MLDDLDDISITGTFHSGSSSSHPHGFVTVLLTLDSMPRHLVKFVGDDTTEITSFYYKNMVEFEVSAGDLPNEAWISVDMHAHVNPTYDIAISTLVGRTLRPILQSESDDDFEVASKYRNTTGNHLPEDECRQLVARLIQGMTFC